MTTRLRTLFGVVLLLCAGAATAANFIVTANNNLTFTPSSLTINKGDTVTFKNNGGFHNVASASFRCANGCDGAGGNGDPSSSAWQATVAFNTVGNFVYGCEVHSGMTGSIKVNDTTPSFTIGPALSGNWRNPAQDGHGFQFEVLKSPAGFVTAFWFVFDNNRNQAYITGAGQIEGNKVVMNSGRRLGAKFPPNFLTSDAVAVPWGTLTFTFTDCDHGHVEWTTTDPSFTPSGGMDIERLTQVAGTTCP
jgi:plastocyanin